MKKKCQLVKGTELMWSLYFIFMGNENEAYRK